MEQVTQPEQQPNRNNRQTNWIIQLIFQLIILRLIYSLFTNYKKNATLNSTEILKTFKNYLKPDDLFDVYGVITNDIRIDLENIDPSQIAYKNENKSYFYKRNSPFEPFILKYKPSHKFLNDKNDKLFLTIFIIPHKAYLHKHEEFNKSQFKEGIEGHYILKTVSLTRYKKNLKPSAVSLMDSETSVERFRGDEEVKYWVPRVDVNLVYDDKEHLQVKNDPYFDTFTKHYEFRLYDPVLYLSQFWVLEEHLVPVLIDAASSNGNVEKYNPAKVFKELEYEKNLFLNGFVTDPNLSPSNNLQQINSLFNNTMNNEDSVGVDNVGVVDPDLNVDEELSKLNMDVDDVDSGLVEGVVDENVDVELEILINFSICSPMYYMFISQMSMNKNVFGIDNSKEMDTIKKMLLNTSPYYLVFSLVFILLHSIFSMFAFKNDIQFWIKNKSMEGLSTITLIINLVSEIIIALYVYDDENRSYMILFEIILNIFSSFWKLTKAIKVKFHPFCPFISISDTSTHIENKTKEYDRIAIKYMSILLTPCVIGYAIYSLYYNKHKSWYSYIISVLAGSVYTFGFIMMTPQLYINYRLKSVEHLPWRALIYKSLNTFVDDVASFLIDMPMLHRLSCFRDDIIFFCYLYQRWKYKVDPNRTIGTTSDDNANTIEKAPNTADNTDKNDSTDSNNVENSNDMENNEESDDKMVENVRRRN
ncbi:Cleft lip and palate transmembrane protein 1 (CLPTM1) family protein [Theileria parva strain Muguga]|uniref:Cleft lip and palate transmembrane protein 1 (CLPTM1) family protein n=1 Tax=Theileria parva strain Muguga TaxID=333668 RepID=UPI001C619B74|nr:Cleft lip and palate transmembrane protein 1 (CLPTM1) family protein [Theileria parva strain Muguga]EAN34389.2 Cleft lip and palate transmembrane protein 1 (CLPTM1) family protein [Theileria parva strain Muguga]